jgi:hypothetical protein
MPFTCVNLRDPPLVVVGGSPTRPCDPQISQISQMGFRPLPNRQLSSWRAVHLRDSAQSVVREAPARSKWMNRRFRRFSQMAFCHSPMDSRVVGVPFTYVILCNPRFMKHQRGRIG